MDITAKASLDAHIPEDLRSSHIGLTSSVLPEVQTPSEEKNSQTGVSTNSVNTNSGGIISEKRINSKQHWYALRTTYGRERKAYDFIISHGGTAYFPTITAEKVISDKKKLVEVSRIPNIFFAYGTEESIKAFVYDNVNLPFLRFYYRHAHVGTRIDKTPLIVPDSQIRSLQIICGISGNNDVVILPDEEMKFKTGQRVRIKEGDFKGVEGIVARFQGQQRVGIVIDGLLTAATAYVPNAFLGVIS